MSNPPCKFGKEQLNSLVKFFQDGVVCNKDSTLKCDSNYANEDACLQACMIVRQFGQGFSFNSLMKTTNEKLNKRYTSCFPSRVLGSGSFGIVLGIVMSVNGNNFTEYALKMTRINETEFESWSFNNELRMHKRFHEIGLAPSLIHYDIFKREKSNPIKCPYSVGIILMERIHSVYQDYIERKNIETANATSLKERDGIIKQRQFWSNEISKLIERCRQFGLTHGDLHTQNIAFIDFSKNGVLSRKMVFIDFGRSTDFYANTILDYAAVSSREKYMIPFLYRSTKFMTLPDCEAKYDGHLRDVFMVRELSTSGRGQEETMVESVVSPENRMGVSDAIVYKLFVTNLANHVNMMEKISEVEIKCGLMENRGIKRCLTHN